MKRFNLLLLAAFTVFVFSGSAEAGEGGILSSVLSKEKPATLPAGSVLMIADFDSGMKPSNIGGDFGAWDKDPADFTQTCMDFFDSAHKHGLDGFGMRLDYDVDSGNPAYNGFWMKLKELDASGFKNLVFFAKGDEEAGYTTVFKVELKNANGEAGKIYVSNLDSEWKKITLPLNQFHGIRNFDKLTEFVIVFEDRMATNKDGVIYIDDIQLTR